MSDIEVAKMSTHESLPEHDTSRRHRRGSTPALQVPNKVCDEQGRSLPPHLQSVPVDVPVHRGPRRPRSNRLLTPDTCPEVNGFSHTLPKSERS